MQAAKEASEPKKKPVSFAKKVLAKQNAATKTEFNRPKVETS